MTKITKAGGLALGGSSNASCTAVPSQGATEAGRVMSTSLWMRGLNSTGNLTSEALNSNRLSNRLEACFCQEKSCLVLKKDTRESQTWGKEIQELILHPCLPAFLQASLSSGADTVPPNPLNHSSLASSSDNHSLEQAGETTLLGFSRSLHLPAPQGLGVTAPQPCLSCWPKRQPRQEVGSLS